MGWEMNYARVTQTIRSKIDGTISIGSPPVEAFARRREARAREAARAASQ